MMSRLEGGGERRFDREADEELEEVPPASAPPPYAITPTPRHIAEDVHTALGQQFITSERMYEQIKLDSWKTITRKWHSFGYRHFGYPESSQVRTHMENEFQYYHLTLASQVPRSVWPEKRDSIIQWWDEVLPDGFDEAWQLPVAAAEIENTMYEVGLGLRRKRDAVGWDYDIAETDALALEMQRADLVRVGRESPVAEVGAE